MKGTKGRRSVCEGQEVSEMTDKDCVELEKVRKDRLGLQVQDGSVRVRNGRDG
jgi:hypothetical protein